MSDPIEDGIARLLRETGPRPAVSPERAARVKDHVRAHWRFARGRRRRARVFGSLAAAATIVLALTVWMATRRSGPTVPVAVVERGTAGASELLPGALLATGASERLAIRTVSRHSVRLDGGSRVRLVSGRSIALESGRIYVDSGGATTKPEVTLEVDTRFGRIEEIGTQYAAWVSEEALEVRAREGRIEISAVGGRFTVDAGQGLRVTAGGARSLNEETASSPAWDWVEDAAPRMAIEGRSLSAFLEWYARERGLSVRFASPEARAGASATVLRGSIEGMSLDEALASVLATSGVRAARSGSELLVEGR